MEQAISLHYILHKRNSTEKRPLKEAVELCNNAGFYRFDYRSSSLAEAYRDREIFEAAGSRVIQTHCPFFRYKEDGLNQFRREAPEAVRIAAALGAEFFVIHADEYRMDETSSSGKTLEVTREYLSPVIELCAEYGLRPAIENLFEDEKRPYQTRFCSEVEDVIGVIESFQDFNVGCCWDSGHHHVAFGKDDFLFKLEQLAPYIICTHIHDNRYGIDMHKPAFFGDIDWEKIMVILKKHHYQGDLSWEFVYERMPEEIYSSYLKFIHDTGNYLLKLQ